MGNKRAINPNNATENLSVTFDGSTGRVDSTPREINLKTADHVRLEMAKVYRETRNGKMEAANGTKFIFMLAQIGKMIELSEFEKRLDLLEGKNHGQS